MSTLSVNIAEFLKEYPPFNHLNSDELILNINDSKKVNKAMREELSEIIKKKAISYSIAVIDNKCIDEKGIGAFHNNRRMRVSARKHLEDSVIATGFPVKGWPGHEEFLDQTKRVMGATAGLRRFGTASLDLAFVAAGRFDGFWEMNLKPWDMAAGILLVTEAGGFVSDLKSPGSPLDTGHVLATNAELQTPLRKVILGTV
jgi:fructose-1,6-bisphosphatase/inositol monophosphatase family enzyme